jgi:hypothetical protein
MISQGDSVLYDDVINRPVSFSKLYDDIIEDINPRSLSANTDVCSDFTSSYKLKDSPVMFNSHASSLSNHKQDSNFLLSLEVDFENKVKSYDDIETMPHVSSSAVEIIVLLRRSIHAVRLFCDTLYPVRRLVTMEDVGEEVLRSSRQCVVLRWKLIEALIEVCAIVEGFMAL